MSVELSQTDAERETKSDCIQRAGNLSYRLAGAVAVIPQFNTIQAFRGGGDDDPRPFRVRQRPAIGAAQLVRTVGMAVKDRDNGLSVLSREPTHPAYFIVGDRKLANRRRNVEGAENSLDKKPIAVFVAQQDATALAWECCIESASQFGAVFRQDRDLDLRHAC